MRLCLQILPQRFCFIGTRLFKTKHYTPIIQFFSDNDGDENERTVTEDKQANLSLLSDEGLEVSAILSDNQGSLDVQDEETVVGR